MSINSKILDKFTEEQIEEFDKLKKSNAWVVVASLARDVLKDTKLNNVDRALPADEYKIECLARLKAIDMFSQIFSDVNTLTDFNKHKKVNYS